jgi:hypothetical protein
MGAMPWGKDEKPRWLSLARPWVVLIIGYNVVWYFFSPEPLRTRSIASMMTNPFYAATLIILVGSGVLFSYMARGRWRPFASHLMTATPRIARTDDAASATRQKGSVLLFLFWGWCVVGAIRLAASPKSPSVTDYAFLTAMAVCFVGSFRWWRRNRSRA